MAADAQPGRAVVKCLIVDDVDENLVALAALLKADDVEVLQANSGTAALELLLLHDVALALLDVQMPEMDGFELAELMRGSERTRRIPIIFVTAGTHDQQRMFRGYDSGAVDFLFKPVEPRVLHSKANVFFRLHRQNLQLASQLHSLRETLRLNEMFAAVLGHDLRGPLAAINLSAEILLRRPDEPVQRVAERIARSCKWMGAMIEDLLDLSRARLGGGIPIDRQPVDLGEIAEQVIHERAAVCPDRRIDTRRIGNTRGHWDADRLGQVVSNIVGNALIHGQASHPITVEVDGTATDRVRFSVTSGGTIAPEIRAHIFDPFRSGREISDRRDGLGLGLYIVDQIVRAHGGSVDVQADLLAGTTVFVVELPR